MIRENREIFENSPTAKTNSREMLRISRLELSAKVNPRES